ncbi:MAG: hypothetical protein WCP32_10200, partial [Bacteroidota bacterium]
MKKFLLMIFALTLWAGSSFGFTGTVQIGSGTTTTSYFPIYSYYGYNYSQQIYLGSEITAGGGAAGVITKVRFYFNSGDFLNWQNWTVYLGNTTKTSFTSTTDWVPVASLSQVFSGNIPTPVIGTWLELTLSAPFNYTGGNLVVAVDENTPGYAAAAATWRSFTASATRGILYYNDATNPDPANPPVANYAPNANIAQVQLQLTTDPCISPVAQPTALVFTPGVYSISGTFTAAAGSDSYLVVHSLSSTLSATPADGTTYAVGAAFGTGVVDYFGLSTSFTTATLAPLTQYYFFVFSANSACVGGPKYLGTNPLTGTSTTVLPTVYTASAYGGLWSSPATWTGGVVPVNGFVDIVIPAGSIVTVDQIASVNHLTINGMLHWGATTYAMSVVGNLTINAGGVLHAYTSGQTGQTINIGGNFTNNGYANLAVATTLINFNGSQVLGGSMNQTLGGTGIFQGDGTNGIIRALFFQTTGSASISTTQNIIITSSFAHTAGSLNTNGKLTMDNTAQVFGQALNRQVANIAVTGMGVAYTNAPVVFGTAVTPWAASTAITLASKYFSGNNVYLCTTAGTTGATAPTSTASTTFTDGTATLLYIGVLGTLGNPFQTTALTVGTQYFYGGNLYVAVLTTAPGTTPPTHTSGVTGSFLYIGTPAKVTVNFDGVTKTVRSLSMVNSGNGYISAAPSLVFSLNGGTVTTAAAASVVFIQQIAGPANSLTQKSAIATISGGNTIVSNQAVGGITTANGGVNYSAAPSVGFPLPTGYLNLVLTGGAGYSTVPTVTVSGGTQLTGGAAPTFAVVVAQGKVVSVNCSGGGTLWTSLPTLTLTGGGYTTLATAAFPTGCLPTATATITNGTITGFTVTNGGFGYSAAPTPALVTNGTVITAATAPTCRIGLYNLTLGWFTPAPSNGIHSETGIVPANRRINVLTMNSNLLNFGANFTGNIDLYNSVPLSLLGGDLNMGGNTLTFSYPTYVGTTGSATYYVSNGSIAYKMFGSLSAQTRAFPFNSYDATGAVNHLVSMGTGTTMATQGSTITNLTGSIGAAPTGGSAGNYMLGSRTWRLQTSGGLYGTAPTVRLAWNGVDNLVTPGDSLYIAQATATTGPWTIRSVKSGGTAFIAATGNRTSGIVAPALIVPTGDDYFGWLSTFAPIPTFLVSPTTLACGYTLNGTYTPEKTYTMTGYYLTGSGNVVVSAPTGFVVSLTTGAGFGPSV